MSSEAEAEHETSSERVKPEEHGEDTRPGSSHFRLPKLAGQLTGVCFVLRVCVRAQV